MKEYSERKRLARSPFDDVADSVDTNAGRAEYIAHMLKTLEAPCRELSSWEDEFLESVGGQFADRGRLSDKQVATLERIYAEKAE